jgi:archaellum component FlaG (FlaF/FlaG flagellin family)
VPVFIGVRRDEGQQMLASKVYNVAAAIPQGSTNTSFSVVSEPLVVPLTQENAAADYTIYVGFEGQRESRPQQARRRR